MCPHHGDKRQEEPLCPALPSSPLRRLLGMAAVVAALTLVVYAAPHHRLPLPSLSSVASSSLVAFLAFSTVLAYRTLTFPNRQLTAPPPLPPTFPVARDAFHSSAARMAGRLAGALAIPTISHDDASRTDREHLLSLHRYLLLSFPLVHERMQLTVINRYSLLYKLTGTDESLPDSSIRALPILFLAHLDVVPVPDAAQWRHPPFDGRVADGRIHGRGAIDDKNNVLALLEVCEYLLQQGVRPRRSLYLAFGHDEEVGGLHGARRIAEHLRAAGVRFEFSLDEGLFIISRIVPGYPKPVALVCTAEKGYLSVELEVALSPSAAGHSAVPGKESAVAILGRALHRLHEHVLPSYYGSREREMMEWLAHGFALPMRVLVSNLWCFGPLLRLVMASKPQTAASVRTTTALTVVRGGEKENVLPATATATVNHRVHPRDCCDGVLRFDRAVVADPRVAVRAATRTEPSAVSSSSSAAFRHLHASVVSVFPHVSVAPCLMVAGTDTKHYAAANLCDHYFRFSATTLDKDEVAMFHGRDESISVDNYANTVLFYYTLIMNCEGRDGGQADGASSKGTLTNRDA